MHLEFESDVLGRRDDEGESRERRRVEDVGAGLTKKDLAQCLRESISSSFGVAASGVAQDLQGLAISCIICWKDFAYLNPCSHDRDNSSSPQFDCMMNHHDWS